VSKSGNEKRSRSAAALRSVPEGSQPERLVHCLESLGDATRLRLLHLLETQELGVVEICEVLQLPQSTVSRHIKHLVERGWLLRRGEGTANIYSMDREHADPTATKFWRLSREQLEHWPAVEQDRFRLAALLRHRRRGARSFFADKAEAWDRLRNEIYGTDFEISACSALLPSDWVVADLGCGTGRLAEELAPQIKQVIAVDHSESMLAQARRRLAEHENVDLRCGEMEALPVADHAVDAALMVLSLSYVEAPRAALAEMRRILRPGGRGVVVDLTRHDREDIRRVMGQQGWGFSADEMKEHFEQAGLGTPHCRILPPDPHAKGPALMLATAETMVSSRERSARE